jgi:hypothetical protein
MDHEVQELLDLRLEAARFLAAAGVCLRLVHFVVHCVLSIRVGCAVACALRTILPHRARRIGVIINDPMMTSGPMAGAARKLFDTTGQPALRTPCD